MSFRPTDTSSSSAIEIWPRYAVRVRSADQVVLVKINVDLWRRQRAIEQANEEIRLQLR